MAVETVIPDMFEWVLAEIEVSFWLCLTLQGA
jgi:hypothetical protein